MKFSAAALAAVAVLTSGGASTAALALDDATMAYKSHVLQCFVLLLTQPAERSRLCGTPTSLPTDPLVVGETRSIPPHPDFACAPGTEWTYRDVAEGPSWVCDWPS